MNSTLALAYPTWFIGLCLLVGAAYALLLYFRSRSFREQSKQLNLLLGLFRFLSVSIICFLLLSPVIKTRSTDSRPPIVVLAQDNSESIRQNMSEEQQQAYAQQVQALSDQLGEQYDLQTFTFGERLRDSLNFDFKDKASNLSELFQELYDLYSGQNLGAVIMASDGIYNQGSNPIYRVNELNVPIYSVAQGDTVPKKDLLVKQIYNNKIAYLGDRFSAQIDIAAVNCAGSSSVLQVDKLQNGQYKSVLRRTISITENDFFKTEEVILDASTVGVQRYRVRLSPVNGEATEANNQKMLYIEVLDARQKILLLAHAPHPDISALKQVVQFNKNYEFELAYPGELKGGISKYDLVVLHQLPSPRHPIPAVLQQLKTEKIPHLFVLGAQSDLNNFNRSQELLSIAGGGSQSNAATPLLRKQFNLFTLEDNLGKKLLEFPPLTVPFGNYNRSPKAEVLLYQRVGSIDTDMPLLLFGEDKGVKVGVLSGEGLWQWRIFDYLQHQNFQSYHDIVGKALQYLSLKEDKRRFRAYASDNVYSETESIVIDAELYNKTYELVNEPEVEIVISNEAGKQFPYVLNRTEKAYRLDVGLFPTGSYRFQATCNYEGERFEAGGEFSVRPIQLESFETTANHQLLSNISQQSGGKLIYPNQLAELPQLLAAQESLRPTLYDTVRTESIINLRWIFFVLMALLGLEWFLRRYFGSY